ncbi:magnesium transporter MgtE N-terminal domain-containing protein [Brevibacterium album]|uniref:magnesium transporter MgtE N-terminal domain-containing protein n=1 Tax=Brevibacterium album TaxID=417948 RepID=UPI0004007FB5|nr:CBS domain-containing protein [Brevibacterium album]
MSGSTDRIFLARLAGTRVFDPLGDQVGRIRDAVIVFRSTRRRRPKVIGFVVEVPGRRRVFVPIGRITSIDVGAVITTGLVNMRRFAKRASETLVLADLLDQRLRLREDGSPVVIEDVGIEQQRNRDWEVSRLFVRRVSEHRSAFSALRRRGETLQLDWSEFDHPEDAAVAQSATQLIAAYQETKPADLADVLRELDLKRRLEVVRELHDERLADVLEELPEDEAVEVLNAVGLERSATLLETMQPDDAADILGELSDERAEQLLQAMEPEDAEDVRTLLAYDEDTAGGLMTSEPIILSPETTIAEALAHVRREELPAAVAAAVFVCRQPLETPTGRYLGLVHIQEMLRHPPHEPIGTLLDTEVEPLPPETPTGDVAALLAAYNLVSVPITDEGEHLVGVVTVDDVLDALLPEDWRENRDSARMEVS